MQQRHQNAAAERARVETAVQQDRTFKRSLGLATAEAAKAKSEAAAALRRVRLEELRVRSSKQASAAQVEEARKEKRDLLRFYARAVSRNLLSFLGPIKCDLIHKRVAEVVSQGRCKLWVPVPSAMRDVFAHIDKRDVQTLGRGKDKYYCSWLFAPRLYNLKPLSEVVNPDPVINLGHALEWHCPGYRKVCRARTAGRLLDESLGCVDLAFLAGVQQYSQVMNDNRFKVWPPFQGWRQHVAEEDLLSAGVGAQEVSPHVDHPAKRSKGKEHAPRLAIAERVSAPPDQPAKLSEEQAPRLATAEKVEEPRVKSRQRAPRFVSRDWDEAP